MGFFLTILTLVVALGLAWRYLGSYMVAVYEGRVHFLGFIERPIYRPSARVREGADVEALRRSLVVFSGLSIGLHLRHTSAYSGFAALSIPSTSGAVPPALSWNTATSFVTNTNWQNYGGEETMSYLSQMARLTVQQFVTPAVGICVALGIIRGSRSSRTRRPSATSGSTPCGACSTSSSPSPPSLASSSWARAQSTR
jgi:K+-transporting ATPase ATPase A chain